MRRLQHIFLFTFILLFLVPTAHALDETSNANDVQLWFRPWETPVNIKINQDVTFELQNEEQVAVSPKDPNNLVAAWRDFRLGYRRVGWGYTLDGGATWTEGGLLSGTPYQRHSDPGVDVDTAGVFTVHVLSFDNGVDYNGLFSLRSYDGGQTFWPIWTTIVDGVVGAFEDKQLMAIDRTGGPTTGNNYVAWTRFTEVSEIFCVASTNDGISFGNPRLVSDFPNVQWPEPAVGTNGEVYVAWVSYYNHAIMFDRSFDAGVTWGTDRVLAPYAFSPGNINGGIYTFPFPALDVDIFGGQYDGRIYCAFADRGPAGTLDIFLTYSDNQGDTWSLRKRVNDDSPDLDVDQFHHWLTVNPDGVVSIVWLDRRLDPEFNYLWDVFITHSFDGGQTFTPNQRISDVSSSPGAAMSLGRETEPVYGPPDAEFPTALFMPLAGLIGEYIGLATSRVRSNIVWTDTRNGHQDIYTAAMNLRLFPPNLATPEDELVTTDPHQVFTWSDWSIYDSALTYALEYSTDPGFVSGVSRINGLSEKTHDPGVLPDDQYYWRVRAFDHYGDSSDWATRSFWIDSEPPEIPVMISPPDGSDIYQLPLVFEWGTVAARGMSGTPITYTLEIAEDENFTIELRTVSSLTESDYEWPMGIDSLAYDVAHYWRVIAEDGAGLSSGSPADPFEFTLNSYMPGDIFTDWEINPVDVVYFVNYVYKAMDPPPDPPIKGDVNCDGALSNPLDVVVLVNYVYKGIGVLVVCTY